MKCLKILLLTLCLPSITHPMNSDSDREEPNFTVENSSDGSLRRRQPTQQSSPESQPQRLGRPVTQDLPLVDNFIMLPAASATSSASQTSRSSGSIFNPTIPNEGHSQRNIFAPVSELDTEEENQNVMSDSESESEASVSASPDQQPMRIQSPSRRNALTPDQANLVRSISQESMLQDRGISRSPMDDNKESSNG